MGFGIPLVMSPAGTAAISSIDFAKQGVASGMINAMRQLGGSIGLALLTAVIIGYKQQIAKASFTTAYSLGFVVCSVFLLIGLLAASCLLKTGQKK